MILFSAAISILLCLYGRIRLIWVKIVGFINKNTQYLAQESNMFLYFEDAGSHVFFGFCFVEAIILNKEAADLIVWRICLLFQQHY